MALFLGVPETLSIAEWKERFKWNFDKAGEVNQVVKDQGLGPPLPPSSSPLTTLTLNNFSNQILNSIYVLDMCFYSNKSCMSINHKIALLCFAASWSRKECLVLNRIRADWTGKFQLNIYAASVNLLT